MSDIPRTASQTRRGKPIQAINPANGSVFEVFITDKRANWVARRGVHAVWEMADLVPATVRKPTSVFEGIRQDIDDDRHSDSDGWLCYVSRPSHAYDRPGTADRTPAREGRVFLVFVNKDRVAYNWRWEKCDAADPNKPEGYAKRFAKDAFL